MPSLLAGLSLLTLGSVVAAQPRPEQPLRTPSKQPATMRPGAGGDEGDEGTGGAKPTAPPRGPGDPGPGEPGPGGPDPTDVFKTPELEFKPKSVWSPVTFNLDDVDLPDLVKAISNITGRRFIYGGKLRQIKASVYAPEKVTVAEAYSAFLAILEMNGMTVIPYGRFLKVVEAAGVSTQTTPVLGTATPVPYEDRYVTRLYRLTHVDATEVATILAKFKTKDADISVYEPSNLLIITDTGTNIRRMLRIIEELDAGGAGDQIWMQPVHYVGAADLATKLGELLESGGGKARILAEERGNQLIIVATESDYHRMLELIKRIDVPDTGEGGIHVLALQHAQCDELQGTLSDILSGSAGGAARAPTAAGGRAAGGAAAARRAAAAGGPEGGVFEGNIRVTCDLATNSLITTSSLRDYAALRNVIDRLDQPRRQVFIEAVIMDVNVNHQQTLGIGYHGGTATDIGGGGDTIIFGGFNAQQSISLPSLEALAFGVRGPDLEGTSTLTPTGISIPALGIALNALASSGDSNVLATPHILATDNIKAEISIGQNIPLQTNIGGLGNLAGLAGGAAGAAGGLGGLGALGMLGGGFSAPRQDVGISLTITPHINDSDQVRMEIIEEISDAGEPSGDLGAVPINKRTADTTVIVRDQQTVVIGGLVRERKATGETKIPVLGDIPVLGVLFRRSNDSTQKTNLLLILTPHIVRGQDDLRAIFERKMQERQEFIDRYFVFNDALPWEPRQDYSRTNGLVEDIRQTQRRLDERARLAREIMPDSPKAHDPVRPIALPSAAAGGGQPQAPQGRQPRRPGRNRPAATQPDANPGASPAPTPTPFSDRGGRTRPTFRIPGGTPQNFRVE